MPRITARIAKYILDRNDSAFRFYHKRLRKYEPTDPIQRTIDQYSLSHPKATFLQVGGNDGKTNDPIYFFVRRDSWRGVILEPQKSAFSRLQDTYKNRKAVQLVNGAVDSAMGFRTLYKLSLSDARWASGLASFSKAKIVDNLKQDFVLRHLENDAIGVPENENDAISEETVECFTFRSVLDKFDIWQLDFLVIDAEGYDYQLLHMFDFQRVTPCFILFEHTLFSDDERRESAVFLKRHGYLTISDQSDTLAIQRSVDCALQAGGSEQQSLTSAHRKSASRAN